MFWLDLINVFGLLLIPFGFHWPGPGTVALTFGAGVLHLIANYFYPAALKAGEASQTLAIVCGFSPVATALVAIALLKHPLGQGSARFYPAGPGRFRHVLLREAESGNGFCQRYCWHRQVSA